MRRIMTPCLRLVSLRCHYLHQGPLQKQNHSIWECWEPNYLM